MAGPEVQLYRYGGEEFLLLAEMDLVAAKNLVEQIRERVRTSTLAREHSAAITNSLRAAQGKAGIDSRSWLKHADDALYKAKETGRDRVCASS